MLREIISTIIICAYNARTGRQAGNGSRKFSISIHQLTQHVESHINSHRLADVVLSRALVDARLESLNPLEC